MVGRRLSAIRIAASAARPTHCHSEWISAQPRAWITSWESQLLSLAMILVPIRIQDAAELFDLFRRGVVPRQGVHHQLAGGAPENPLQHVAGELPLGLVGPAAGLIDMGAVGLVTAHATLGSHALQQLQDPGLAEI